MYKKTHDTTVIREKHSLIRNVLVIFASYHKSFHSIFIRNKTISHLFLSLSLYLVEKVTVIATKIKVYVILVGLFIHFLS